LGILNLDVEKGTCHFQKKFDTRIGIHVSNLTRVFQYACQIVQFVTFSFDTRNTRVKMHVSKCLTRVRHCTRVKLHVAICYYFCSVNWGLNYMNKYSNNFLIDMNCRNYTHVMGDGSSPIETNWRAAHPL
jgi:hypothetical protein